LSATGNISRRRHSGSAPFAFPDATARTSLDGSVSISRTSPVGIREVALALAVAALLLLDRGDAPILILPARRRR
jgi:hypothetical protein